MTGDPGKALPEAGGNPSSRLGAIRAGFRAGFSRSGPLWTVLLIAGMVGAVLVIAADFATLRSVKVLTASCSDLADPSLRGSCVTHGYEEHSYALVLIGAASLVMTWGATIGRSRPAAVALAVLGGAVLVIALATDVPDIHKTGVLGDRFESATAEAGAGLWMEIVGGALVFVSGIVAFAGLRPARSRRAERERFKRREARIHAGAEEP
jgi:hypothetical protein